eukprot:364938-Chlamydomonas_euryale.AAC.47
MSPAVSPAAPPAAPPAVSPAAPPAVSPAAPPGVSATAACSASAGGVTASWPAAAAPPWLTARTATSAPPACSPSPSAAPAVATWRVRGDLRPARDLTGDGGGAPTPCDVPALPPTCSGARTGASPAARAVLSASFSTISECSAGVR